MTDKQQIKELLNDIWETEGTTVAAIAEHLHSVGWRKIRKNSYIRYKWQDRQAKQQVKRLLKQRNEAFIKAEMASCETAKKIIEMFSDKNFISEDDLIAAIAERFIMEVNNDCN